MLTGRIPQALALALEAHTGQKRKGTDIPHIAHAMAVAAIALEHVADEAEQAMAALLHGAVEDGESHFSHHIRAQFDDRVANIVESYTDGVSEANGKKEECKPRKQRYLARLPQAAHCPHHGERPSTHWHCRV
jgi:(p)ppGpp synthase/HD superfamily hydrolase